MRAILIDPYAKEIREVEHNGDFREIYTLLTEPDIHEVGTFSTVRLNRRDAVFIDDNGLYVAESRPEDVRFFQLAGYEQPLAGKGLVLGSDAEGESISTGLPLELFQEHVTFPEIKFAGWTKHPEPDGDVDTPMGKAFVIHGPVPMFEPRVEGEAKAEPETV